ncbi:small ribosomal subunit Rsm22 family protein [Pelagicoccus albus]|uniref:Small ribosomal subunit Rsm22 n=1 Tax=Pelagicoccus albus TaxID=415222 RepID=A0A7X1B6I2_9BACT|nr:small ribosomal subunit Rsm22 family protein [Pelagicoccus albus]MBC2606551.1 hypothetical protein [Pelagicoccus albus]
MQDTEINWDTLQRLRAHFLETSSTPGVYWQNESDLADYHATFAARIGWKWDSALLELRKAGFTPISRKIFDWGCGSGIATLRVLEFFGASYFDEVYLWDHSAAACRFAQKTISQAYPQLQVKIAPAPVSGESSELSDALALVSHAVSELGYEAQQSLSKQLRTAAQLIFVEPGNHSASRKLIAQREALRDAFSILAPCSRCDSCPMLEDENTRHWCHFFGKPPVEAFTESFWTKFSQTMEIDLRSLPYSFLAMQKTVPAERGDSSKHSRLIGRPRQFKGYTRLLSCDQEGLRDLELQKRDDKQLWKVLKKGPDTTLFEWTQIDASTGRLKSGVQI